MPLIHSVLFPEAVIMALDMVCHLKDAQQAEEWFEAASYFDEEISFEKGIYMHWVLNQSRQ